MISLELSQTRLRPHFQEENGNPELVFSLISTQADFDFVANWIGDEESQDFLDLCDWHPNFAN